MKLGRLLLSSSALRFVSFLIGLWLGTTGLESSLAAAQECPYGYPVDCGTYCCESGGVCYNGGCNAPVDEPDPSAGSCPSGYPVDCGSYCCESGGVCYNGGCNAPADNPDPNPGAGSCPSGYPVDCGSYCCESGGVCYNGGCNAPGGATDPGGSCPAGYPVDCGSYCCESGGSCYDGGCNAPGGSDPDPGAGSCPSGYPVDCGTFCCSSGASCGSNETCLAGSTTESSLVESCPPSYPVDCGNDYCCPSGSSCTVDGCTDFGGAPIGGSDLICASQAVGTTYGTCNLDFCIANADGACESYYLVNGARITCSGCAADQTCISMAAEACTDTGVASGPSVDNGGGCCQAYDACEWANDSVCDCDGAYSNSWDVDDCDGIEDEDDAVCSVGDIGVQRGRTGGSIALMMLGLALLFRRRRS